MFKPIKAFLTAKIFLTKGQVVDLGSLYMLEEEIVRLNHVIGGLKASFTKQDKKCAECKYHPNFVCGEKQGTPDES
jgi:hypothetical protein